MSIWSIMNGAAWVFSALLFLRIVWDFVGVERDRRKQDRDTDTPKDDAR